MKKAKALKTLMIAGKVYLADQVIPEIEDDQYWRLYEANAVEVIEEKKKRKRRTKAEMKAAKHLEDKDPLHPHPHNQIDQQVELDIPLQPDEVEAQDTIPVPLEEDDVLPLSELPM